MHLVRKLEKIDRDLEELENIRGRVQEDRDYAGRLRESLTEESRRLKDLRGRILTQVIKVPAAGVSSPLVGASSNAAAPKKQPASSAKKSSRKTAASREPEIILPGKSSKASAKSSARSGGEQASAASESAAAEPAAAEPKAASKRGGRGKSRANEAPGKTTGAAANKDAKPADSFQFRYE